MNIDILTIFPEIFKTFLETSIIGRAVREKIVKIGLVNIRDFSLHKNKNVDDYPYGGGPGMLMMAQPIYDAYCSILKKNTAPYVILTSPKGNKLTHKKAKGLSSFLNLIIICGHYEGIDQRLVDKIVSEEISLGDFVLTGGEIPAMAIIDSIVRLLPGVLGNENSSKEESFSKNLLEYPQYTRPRIWENISVPEILTSGNHKEIEKWRTEESIKITQKNRPDLFFGSKYDTI